MSDGRHLKSIAHRDFIRAMRTGRMMAFVGSYATEELGYPKWEKLLRGTLPYSKDGRALLDKDVAPLGHREWLREGWKGLGDPKADRVLIYELLHQYFRSAEAIGDGLAAAETREGFDKVLRRQADRLFALPSATRTPSGKAAVWQVCRGLGIRRIITTNYDMELEYELMVDDADRRLGLDAAATERQARRAVFDRCRAAGTARREQARRGNSATSRFDFALEHTMPDSRRILSDCFQRERSDKLFEFAIGSPDHAWHIMHLHGRISDPETLIISYSDYERQYRQSSITKLPFEHALKMLFAGNPVLFVGMGMSEEEILGILRQFVSDGGPSHVAQHFVIWSTTDGTVTPANELFRLRLFRQFNVYVLFDSELDAFYVKKPKEEAVAQSIASLAEFADAGVNPFDWTDGRSNLHDGAVTPHPLGTTPPPLSTGGDFRDMQGFLPIPLPPAPSSAARIAHDRRLSCGSLIWGTRHRGARPPGRANRPSFSDFTVGMQPLPAGTAFGTHIDWSGTSAEQYVTHALCGGSPIKAFIDRPGAGHGHLAAIIGDFFLDQVAAKRETIYFQLNGTFSWELDSAFSLLSGLFDDRTAFRAGMSRDRAAQIFFDKIAQNIATGAPMSRALVIAINGAERYFDPSGYPLSNELDLLIRQMPLIRKNFQYHALKHGHVGSGHAADEALHDYIVQKNDGVPPVTLLLFGTARVGRYLASLGFEQGDFAVNGIADYDVISNRSEPLRSSEPEPGMLLAKLDEIQNKAGKPNPLRGADGDAFNSLYFRSVREAFHTRLGIVDPGTTPGETPLALWTALQQSHFGPDANAARAFFDLYMDARLLARVMASSTDPEQGGRHAALALEMLRILAFVGQPVSTATLAVALFGARRAQGRDAKPADAAELAVVMRVLLELNLVLEIDQFPGINPKDDPSMRRYGLHRALLHEVRDRNSVPFSDARNYTSFNIPLLTAQPIDDHEPEESVQHIIEHMVDELIEPPGKDEAERAANIGGLAYGLQLRAACASLRSYYTTSALLMHEPSRAPSEHKSPKLLNHAERLGRLIHFAERSAEAHRRHGTSSQSPNFFADDIVWLHAQRGVALMAMGDAYGARDSMGKAGAINDRFVEFGEHGQNWRRIQLNQIHLDVERAKIASAEARIRDLKSSINRAVDDSVWHSSWLGRTGEKKPHNAFEAIMQAYGAEPRLRVREVDRYFAADLILATGLACGYRGWCEYLRGRLRTAEHYLAHCIQILRNIGEQRAYAMFSRHYASLQYALGKPTEGADALRLCQAAADSSRQLDISHLAALTRAEHRITDCDGQDRALLLHSVMDSLRYATLTDMYRVRMEARRVLALMRLKDGDYDGALEQVSEALGVAARFGFSLRKITLRILIGQILIRRGDPIAGNAMLDKALRIADRMGYQRAVEEAHRVRLGE